MGTDKDYDAYKEALNAATNEVRKSKRNVEHKLAQNIKSDSKSFYAYVRSKQNVRYKVGSLEDNAGNIITQEFLMAEELNRHFSSVFTREDTSSLLVRYLYQKPETENRYNLCDIPERYAVEVKNRFAALDLIDREPEELWQEVEAIVKDEAKNNIPKARKPKKSKWLTKKAIEIADKRREAKKGHAHPDEVRKLNAEFQRQSRKDKEDYLNRACKEIEDENRKGKTRDLFKKIREVTGKFKPRIGGLKSKSGNDLSEEGTVKEGWRYYTENLYKRDDNMTTIYDETKECEEEATILEEEVRKALKALSNGKSPGSDGIPIELLKEVDEEAIKVLTAICQQIWIKRIWPKQWKESIYVPIPKKGDPRICSNNRTIALISHASKVMLKVIQPRLDIYMKQEMGIEQAGFTKGRGTRDQISNIRWIMERSTEYQRPIYMCFIDYSKAFDCVDHPTLWNMMEEMGVPEHMVQVIRSLYANQEAKVRTEYGDTESFSIGKGVRQGCVLSPYLFNLYSEYIMRQANLEELDIGVKMGGRKINNLRYADDTTLLAESKEELLQLVTNVKEKSAQAGLYLNLKKTKVMSTEEIEEFELDGENIEIVRDFVFLGAKIEDSGSCKGEILRRLALGRAAMTGLNKIWKDKDITITTKCRIVNALVFPVVLYGCESWTIRKAERRRIDSFELWCWRRLLRIPWTARRTNQSVIEEIKPTNPLEALIKKQQLSYFGHIMRSENSLEKSMMLGMGGGARKRGRPRARWLDDIKAITNCTLTELCALTRDRDAWRETVMGITRSRPRLDGTR